MIDPPVLALRRRSEELVAASAREYVHDIEAAALMLFYAAECGLKSIYMIQNSLRTTADTRGAAASARSFVHNITVLAAALRVPKSVYAPPAPFVLQRTGLAIDVSYLHQAGRYGEKLADTPAAYTWLLGIVNWIRQNR